MAKTRHNPRALRTVALAVGLLGLIPAATFAAEGDSPGKRMYLKYCSACHGEGGKGDGVVSGFLRPKPTDLTRIAKDAGGKFPFIEVMEGIDGTKTVRAHGDPEMPVWGEMFREPAGSTIEWRAEVRGKVLLITDYLSTIQAK